MLQIQDRSPHLLDGSHQRVSVIGCTMRPVLIVATGLGIATCPEHKHMHCLKLFQEWFISFIHWVWVWESTPVAPC